MIPRLISWLQLGRAQTYPADLLLVMVPFLVGFPDPFQILTLAILMFFIHWSSFGENSVLDFTQGYDRVDPAKSHHPLPSGKIDVSRAINVIHVSKALCAVVAIILMFSWSPNPALAMAMLFLWYVWGTAYNAGLSKETVFGFIPIVICFATMAAWGWFLMQPTLNAIGWTYVIYCGAVILFQIAWSGHLKDLEQFERSNLLIRLGARIETMSKIITVGNQITSEYFNPKIKAMLFGLFSKGLGIIILWSLFLQTGLQIDKLIWTFIITLGMFFLLIMLVIPRYWNKIKEMKKMSMMEVLSIFAPIPLLLNWGAAITLMVFAFAWFYLANKYLWGTRLYPKV